jgi:hypothetical protein
MPLAWKIWSAENQSRSDLQLFQNFMTFQFWFLVSLLSLTFVNSENGWVGSHYGEIDGLAGV